LTQIDLRVYDIQSRVVDRLRMSAHFQRVHIFAERLRVPTLTWAIFLLGPDKQQEAIFSYIAPEKRVPAEHPLRPIRKMVDEILKEMPPKFQKLRVLG
jgi:hypothetical protein